MRQERLDDAKRASLMEAAMEEFADRGIESASYNKIIERSGLSKGTVYYYFDNKDSLLLTVLGDICARFHQAIGDLEPPDTKEKYWATDREYSNRVIRFFFENPKLWRVLSYISKDAPHIGKQFDSFSERVMCFMDKLIVKGQEIGAVRNDISPDTAQRLIHALGRVLSTVMLEGREDAPPGERELEKERDHMEKFIAAMHDLSKRILTPEEDLRCMHF